MLKAIMSALLSVCLTFSGSAFAGAPHAALSDGVKLVRAYGSVGNALAAVSALNPAFPAGEYFALAHAQGVDLYKLAYTDAVVSGNELMLPGLSKPFVVTGDLGAITYDGVKVAVDYARPKITVERLARAWGGFRELQQEPKVASVSLILPSAQAAVPNFLWIWGAIGAAVVVTAAWTLADTGSVAALTALGIGGATLALPVLALWVAAYFYRNHDLLNTELRCNGGHGHLVKSGGTVSNLNSLFDGDAAQAQSGLDKLCTASVEERNKFNSSWAETKRKIATGEFKVNLSAQTHDMNGANRAGAAH